MTDKDRKGQEMTVDGKMKRWMSEEKDAGDRGSLVLSFQKYFFSRL